MTPSRGPNGDGNVNAILKAGTRTFYGDIYEFFRNDVLNAIGAKNMFGPYMADRESSTWFKWLNLDEPP